MFTMNKKLKHLLKANIYMAVGLLFPSCHQTMVIHNPVQSTEPYNDSLWLFMQECLLDWSFALWLTIYILVALFLWRNGYNVLKWFNDKSLSNRIVIVFFILAAIFAIGCIPQNTYGGWFALPIIAVFCSTFIVINSLLNRYKFRFKDNKDKGNPIPEEVRHQQNLLLMAKIMLWVWSCGWLLYFLAIGIARWPHVGAEVTWRSAIDSLNLFVINIDSSIISDIQGHDILKGLISCSGLMAVLCTILLILNLVIFRLRSYLHIRHISINSERNHLYLFFGLNDASKLLEKDIYEKDSQSVIVFVDSIQNNSEQDEDKIDGWKRIIKLFTHRRRAFIDAREDDRRALAISNCDICSLEDVTNDVLGNIGVESVKRLIQNLKGLKDAQLHIFFLSEDRETNVRSTAILAKDELIGSKEFQTIIYCHARRNTINRVIEDLGIDKEQKTEVRILDSSYLAIEQLKRNVKNHPVSYVTVSNLYEENSGSVTSNFVSLVMGFGETGQEAVDFLYEYGAFVDKNATQDDSKRSPFKCYVLDNEMKKLEGHYISERPGASFKRCNEENEKALIRFYPFDYRSDEFFTEILEKIYKELNYVVVAIGDDEQNMTAAVEILRYVRKKRQNLDNFCIYVRAYEKGTFKHLKVIADHYNSRLSKNGEIEKKIIPFGQNEQIYTYELIVKDKYQEDGRNYYETYRSLQIDPANDEGTWEQRQYKIINDSKSAKWERMSKIRRKESQDRSNALHALTKMKILQDAIGENNVNDFITRVIGNRTGQQAGITYRLLSPSERHLMLNLAMCEHLRWNAAHEMMGYVNNTKKHVCDELKKEHNCLKDWQELDSESINADYPVDYKLFDFGVVETSFKLYNMKLKENRTHNI